MLPDLARAFGQFGVFLVRPVRGTNDYAGAFEAALRARAEALFVMDDGGRGRRLAEGGRWKDGKGQCCSSIDRYSSQ